MNEAQAGFSFMDQTQSGERPRALAQKLKPLAIPDSGLQTTTIFNESHSFGDDLGIIKHLKLSYEREIIKETAQANYRMDPWPRPHSW